MKKMGFEQDEIELADMELGYLIRRSEMIGRRAQVETDVIKVRIMQVNEVREEELYKESMKLVEMDRELMRRMQRSETNFQQISAEMEIWNDGKERSRPDSI